MRPLLLLMTSAVLLTLSSAEVTVPFEAVKGHFEASRLALKTLVMKESIFSHREGLQRQTVKRKARESEESPRCVFRGAVVLCDTVLHNG
ncbi:Hypp7109 [Branchiostoma lanceolatum]|uniref:Hypp7109 protein n=1 Tax=Branchiostoma lanceolatum TaxID=7740 RepID=A0A8J9YXH9_BRALA|nr:Hypp7109 [Branchiostoma lanceolatum]